MKKQKVNINKEKKDKKVVRRLLINLSIDEARFLAELVKNDLKDNSSTYLKRRIKGYELLAKALRQRSNMTVHYK